jgi:hypothetical protein
MRHAPSLPPPLPGFWYRTPAEMEAAGLGHVPSEMVDALERSWNHKFPSGYTQVSSAWILFTDRPRWCPQRGLAPCPCLPARAKQRVPAPPLVGGAGGCSTGDTSRDAAMHLVIPIPRAFQDPKGYP